MMKAKLYCKTGLLAGTKYEFTRGVSIGRSGENSIVLEPPLISEVHARIFYDAKEDSYFLEDMGSRNGTYLDGMRITRRERLGLLHVITLAKKFDFIFQVLNPAPAASAPALPEEVRNDNAARAVQAAAPAAMEDLTPSTDFVHDPAEEKRIFGGPVWQASPIRSKKNGHAAEPAPQASSAPAPAAAKARPFVRKPTNCKTLIEELLRQAPRSPQMLSERDNAVTMVEAQRREAATPDAGPAPLHLEASIQGTRQTFTLKEGENIIGRSPLCEICIDDPSISRQHAVLQVSAGQVWVKDLGSRNHTYVQGATVAMEMAVVADVPLRFGSVEAKLINPA